MKPSTKNQVEAQALTTSEKSERLASCWASRHVVFIGTGLSLWDVTHSDTFTPAWLLHVGVPLGTHPKHPVYFLGEGRLLFDHADDVQNNYQVWGGVRIHL